MMKTFYTYIAKTVDVKGQELLTESLTLLFKKWLSYFTNTHLISSLEKLNWNSKLRFILQWRVETFKRPNLFWVFSPSLKTRLFMTSYSMISISTEWGLLTYYLSDKIPNIKSKFLVTFQTILPYRSVNEAVGGVSNSENTKIIKQFEVYSWESYDMYKSNSNSFGVC